VGSGIVEVDDVQVVVVVKVIIVVTVDAAADRFS
jgi:hypothetical protein